MSLSDTIRLTYEVVDDPRGPRTEPDERAAKLLLSSRQRRRLDQMLDEPPRSGDAGDQAKLQVLYKDALKEDADWREWGEEQGVLRTMVVIVLRPTQLLAARARGQSKSWSDLADTRVYDPDQMPFAALRVLVSGWEGFQDEKGNTLAFSEDAMMGLWHVPESLVLASAREEITRMLFRDAEEASRRLTFLRAGGAGDKEKQ